MLYAAGREDDEETMRVGGRERLTTLTAQGLVIALLSS